MKNAFSCLQALGVFLITTRSCKHNFDNCFLFENINDPQIGKVSLILVLIYSTKASVSVSSIRISFVFKIVTRPKKLNYLAC